MAMRVEIRCVNKIPRDDSYRRIANVGGLNFDSTRWKLTEEHAIAGIRNGQYEFFVTVGGRVVEVVIATSALGNAYLKTVADGFEPNNLLALPECP